MRPFARRCDVCRYYDPEPVICLEDAEREPQWCALLGCHVLGWWTGCALNEAKP